MLNLTIIHNDKVEKMASENSKQEIKRLIRKKIFRYIYETGSVSRQDIARALGISFPTVFSNVNELLNSGLLVEIGKYASTGGRKAKRIIIKEKNRYSVGIDITKHHIRFLIYDLSGKTVSDLSIKYDYVDTQSYYDYVAERLTLYLKDNGIVNDKVIGVGISLPGIVDTEKGVFLYSHILNVSNIDLRHAFQAINFPLWFENDANCAAYGEIVGRSNTAYFSLSYSVGGASYFDGKLHAGDNLRAGEFGHMLLHPGGTPCYCGKHGCIDAYLSVPALLEDKDDTLDQFFQQVEYKDPEHLERWNRYLDNLSVAVTNIRMILDCDVVLGGYIGNYIEKYLGLLAEKATKYNLFDHNTSYIKTGKNKQNSSAIGIAQIVVDRYIDSLI